MASAEEEEWLQPEQAISSKTEVSCSSPRKRRIALGVFVALFLICVAVLVAKWGIENRQEIKSRSSLTVNVPSGMPIGASAEAADTLKNFYKSSGLDRRQSFVHHPLRHHAEIQQYLSRNDLVEPRHFDFRNDQSLARKTASAAFFVADRAPGEGAPIVARFIRDLHGELKLDWELYAQSYDDQLRKFCSEPSEGLQMFWGNVRRIENGKGRAVCVAISDFGSPSTVIRVALDKKSAMGQRVISLLDEGESRPMSVRLHWEPVIGRIEISEIDPMLPKYSVLRAPAIFAVE